MAKLIILTEGRRGEHELGEHNTVGRQPDSTVQVMDELMSKQHAAIVWDNGEWTLRDLGSVNGTFVNDTRIECAVLHDGDEIRMGDTKMWFSEPAPDVVEPAPHVTISPGDTNPHVNARLDEPDQRQFAPVEHIRDVEQLKRDYEKLRIANELNRAIGLEPDIDKLLARILEETFKLLPADRGVILLLDPQTNAFVPRASKQKHPSNEQIVLSNTILREVFQRGAAVLTTDAMMDSRFSSAKSVMMAGMRSTMCVPMIYRSRLLGILHLDSLYASGAFSEKDLQILTGLAAQAAQAVDNAHKARELERNALARRDFERLLPPEVVEQVVAGKVKLERGGQLRETTVLFSDVRGFTQWSEKHEPDHIVSVLNEYFELMVEAIHKHHGTLDKFMGDGLMALFGAPITHGHDSVNAVLCALDMMERLAELNARLNAFEYEEVAIGIGINTGPVIAGYMGSSKSMEYTAIGDHVNLAARLCGVAAPGQILLSEHTLRAVAGAFEVTSRPAVQVKGKRDPVPIFELHGRAGAPQVEDTTGWDDTTGVSKFPYPE